MAIYVLKYKNIDRNIYELFLDFLKWKISCKRITADYSSNDCL